MPNIYIMNNDQRYANILSQLSNHVFNTELVNDIYALMYNNMDTPDKQEAYARQHTIFANILAIYNSYPAEQNPYILWMQDTHNLNLLINKSFNIAFNVYLNIFPMYFFTALPSVLYFCYNENNKHDYDTFLNLSTNIIYMILKYSLINAVYQPYQNLITNNILLNVVIILKYKNTFTDVLTHMENNINISAFFEINVPQKLTLLIKQMIINKMDAQLMEIKNLYPDTTMLDFEVENEGNSMILAAKYGCIQVVEHLLTLPSAAQNVLRTNAEHLNTVYYAAKVSESALRLFLRFPDQAFDVVDQTGKTPLWIACKNKYKNILLDVIRKTTPMHYGLPNGGFTPLMLCCGHGFKNAAIMLLDSGSANVEYDSEQYGNALLTAVSEMSDDELCERIIASVQNKTINRYDARGVLTTNVSDEKKLRDYYNSYHDEQITVLMQACQKKLRRCANALLSLDENIVERHILVLNTCLDVLCYFLLNDWDTEVMKLLCNNAVCRNRGQLTTKFDIYYSKLLSVNNVPLTSDYNAFYCLKLHACLQTYLCKHNAQKSLFSQVLADINQYIAVDNKDNMTVREELIDTGYSSLEGGDVELNAAIAGGDIVLLHNNNAYITTVEFLLNVVNDDNKIKFGCNKLVNDFTQFDETNDLYYNNNGDLQKYVSLTLLGMPSGIIDIGEVYAIFASSKRVFRLTETAGIQPFPAMMSKAFYNGTVGIGADHCQPDAQGNPVSQQPFSIVPVEIIVSKRKRGQTEVVESAAKRAAPTISVMVSGNTYGLGTGFNNTLRELHDEIMAINPAAASFRIIYGGAVIRSSDLLNNGSVQISEYMANGRKIFNGTTNVVLQVMFTAALSGGKPKRSTQIRTKAKHVKQTKRRHRQKN